MSYEEARHGRYDHELEAALEHVKHKRPLPGSRGTSFVRAPSGAVGVVSTAAARQAAEADAARRQEQASSELRQVSSRIGRGAQQRHERGPTSSDEHVEDEVRAVQQTWLGQEESARKALDDKLDKAHS